MQKGNDCSVIGPGWSHSKLTLYSLFILIYIQCVFVSKGAWPAEIYLYQGLRGTVWEVASRQPDHCCWDLCWYCTFAGKKKKSLYTTFCRSRLPEDYCCIWNELFTSFSQNVCDLILHHPCHLVVTIGHIKQIPEVCCNMLCCDVIFCNLTSTFLLFPL